MTEPENRSANFISIQPDRYDWKLETSIHVWKFPVLSSGSSMLTDSERIIGARFRFEADRNRFITGRKSIRFLLSKYLSVNPLEIHILSGKGLKPTIKSPVSSIRFNISHSGEWVVVALAQSEVGIDIEKIDSNFDYSNLLLEHFSREERQFISDAKIPVAAFYFLWTRKEALTKAEGAGLHENLKTILSLDQGSNMGLQNREWKIESFNLSRDYPVSLAYCGSPGQICYLDGTSLLAEM